MKAMKWIMLIIACLFEIGWAVSLKFAHGFTKPIPSIFTIVGMIASFYFLSLALKKSAFRYSVCYLDRDRHYWYCNLRCTII